MLEFQSLASGVVLTNGKGQLGFQCWFALPAKNNWIFKFCLTKTNWFFSHMSTYGPESGLLTSELGNIHRIQLRHWWNNWCFRHSPRKGCYGIHPCSLAVPSWRWCNFCWCDEWDPIFIGRAFFGFAQDLSHAEVGKLSLDCPMLECQDYNNERWVSADLGWWRSMAPEAWNHIERIRPSLTYD